MSEESKDRLAVIVAMITIAVIYVASLADFLL